jgi:hypothetical protein
MLYRVLRDLQKGSKIIYTGSISNLDGIPPASIEKLIDNGAISEVSPPPLRELPGWTTRAAKIETLGIITATQFLEATDYEPIKKLFRVKDETIEIWKKQIVDVWLSPPPVKRGK